MYVEHYGSFIVVKPAKMSNGSVMKKNLDNVLKKLKTELKEEVLENITELRKTVINNLSHENRCLRETVVNLEDRIIELERTLLENGRHCCRNNVEIAVEHLDDRIMELKNSLYETHQNFNKCMTVIQEEPENENVNKNTFDEVKEDACVDTCGRLSESDESESKSVENNTSWVEDSKNKPEVDKHEVATQSRDRRASKIKNPIDDMKHLGLYYRNLAYNCRKLKRTKIISEMKIENGKIEIRCENGTWSKVTDKDDLTKMFPDFQEFVFH